MAVIKQNWKISEYLNDLGPGVISAWIRSVVGVDDPESWHVLMKQEILPGTVTDGAIREGWIRHVPGNHRLVHVEVGACSHTCRFVRDGNGGWMIDPHPEIPVQFD